MIDAKITGKTASFVHFRAESPVKITEDEAMTAQTQLGFIPQGYAFEGFRVERDPVLLRYIATWRCYRDCS